MPEDLLALLTRAQGKTQSLGITTEQIRVGTVEASLADTNPKSVHEKWAKLAADVARSANEPQSA
jgi:hypothetical protein